MTAVAAAQSSPQILDFPYQSGLQLTSQCRMADRPGVLQGPTPPASRRELQSSPQRTPSRIRRSSANAAIPHNAKCAPM
eukprot:2694958-Rhodomonas_salina.1